MVSRLREELGSQEVAAIISLTRGWRKVRISPADALDAAKIHSILNKFGGSVDDLPVFLSEIHQKCKNEGISPSQLIQHCSQSTQIQERTGLSFEDLKEEYSTLADQKVKLDEDISTAEDQKRLAEKEAATVLAEKNLTVADIAEFNNLKEELQDNGVEYTDISKLCKILRQAKQCNYDLEKITTHLEKENNHEEQILEYQNQIKQLETQKEDQSEQNKILSDILDAKSKLADIIKKFEDAGIEFIHLEKLYGMVTDISRQHGIDKKVAITKFHDDLQNNYDVILGLKTQIKSLNDEMDAKSTRLDSLETKIENLKLKHREEQNIIAIIKSLKQNRIDPFIIITWNKILETSNLKPKMFEEKLQKFTNVNQLITAEQHELDQLTKEKKELESVLEFLESNKEKLESIIKYGNELIKKSLAENIQETVNQIKRTTEIGNNSIRITKDHVIESINKISQKTSKQIDEYINKTKDLVNSATEASEKVGRAESFIPLYSLANGSLEPTTQFPVLVALLDKLCLEIQRKGNGSSSLLYDIKELREELIKELSKIEQN